MSISQSQSESQSQEGHIGISTSQTLSISLPAPFSSTSPPPTIITQGAEGLLLKTCFLSPSQPAALKIRPSKAYRHPLLDQRLTKQRVLAEARVLAKLGSLGSGSKERGEVRVPKVYGVEWRSDAATATATATEAGEGVVKGSGVGAWLLMEWIEGSSVRQLLQAWDRRRKEQGSLQKGGEEAVRGLLRRIGAAVGKMHSLGGVVHGDLTSSNIMVRPDSAFDSDSSREGGGGLGLAGEIVLIDFGLASQSIQDEDRAVDLYVLERAFGSTHPRQEGMFNAEVLESQEGYRGSFKGSSVVLKRLEEVRLRGRKRSMVG